MRKSAIVLNIHASIWCFGFVVLTTDAYELVVTEESYYNRRMWRRYKLRTTLLSIVGPQIFIKWIQFARGNQVFGPFVRMIFKVSRCFHTSIWIVDCNLYASMYRCFGTFWSSSSYSACFFLASHLLSSFSRFDRLSRHIHMFSLRAVGRFSLLFIRNNIRFPIECGVMGLGEYIWRRTDSNHIFLPVYSHRNHNAAEFAHRGNIAQHYTSCGGRFFSDWIVHFRCLETLMITSGKIVFYSMSWNGYIRYLTDRQFTIRADFDRQKQLLRSRHHWMMTNMTSNTGAADCTSSKVTHQLKAFSSRNSDVASRSP